MVENRLYQIGKSDTPNLKTFAVVGPYRMQGPCHATKAQAGSNMEWVRSLTAPIAIHEAGTPSLDKGELYRRHCGLVSFALEF